jgi:cellulose biosynthesis protein BcsQ
MLICTWSDKGGAGKTTLAIELGSYLKAKLLDLDRQGDLWRWAGRAGHPCEHLNPESLSADQITARLVAAAEDDALWLADSRCGRAPEELRGMAFSQAVIIPARSGDQDLVALSRALSDVKRVRANGNPGLKAGIVLNASSQNRRRDRNTEEGLRAVCMTSGETYLGKIKDRLVYPDAYSQGKTAFGIDGGAKDELAEIFTNLTTLIGYDAAAAHAA